MATPVVQVVLDVYDDSTVDEHSDSFDVVSPQHQDHLDGDEEFFDHTAQAALEEWLEQDKSNSQDTDRAIHIINASVTSVKDKMPQLQCYPEPPHFTALGQHDRFFITGTGNDPIPKNKAESYLTSFFKATEEPHFALNEWFMDKFEHYGFLEEQHIGNDEIDFSHFLMRETLALVKGYGRLGLDAAAFVWDKLKSASSYTQESYAHCCPRGS